MVEQDQDMTRSFAFDASAVAVRPPYPPDMQVAALCWRKVKGSKEVLLVTSRDTGRWIVPKGWPIDGMNAAESALQEAWEEAGVRGTASKAKLVGTFSYDKRLDNGTSRPLIALVYKLRVRKRDLSDRFPEVEERERLWLHPKKAAKLVDEPELQEILRRF